MKEHSELCYLKKKAKDARQKQKDNEEHYKEQRLNLCGGFLEHAFTQKVDIKACIIHFLLYLCVNNKHNSQLSPWRILRDKNADARAKAIDWTKYENNIYRWALRNRKPRTVVHGCRKAGGDKPKVGG